MSPVRCPETCKGFVYDGKDQCRRDARDARNCPIALRAALAKSERESAALYARLSLHADVDLDQIGRETP